MYRELSDRIELRLSNTNHKVGFIIYNNKKALDITKFISNDLIKMGLEGVNESYSLPRVNWVVPSMGIVEKLNEEITTNEILKNKIEKAFPKKDIQKYISISSN